MADNPQMPVELYPLAQGHLPGLSPGTLIPGSGLPPWRDMLNLRIHDGQLRLREPVIDSAFAAPSYTLNNATRYALPLLVMEIPMSPFFGQSRFLVITTMDWWIVNSGTWHNVTPSYTAGSVTVAGSAVTGAGGTNWLIRGVKPGDLIQLPDPGNWFYITDVASDTGLTIDGSPGALGPGATYNIRRTVLAAEAEAARIGCFARVLNGDILVAGLFGGGRTFGSANVNQMDGAVLTILGGAMENVLSYPAASFLTAGQREVMPGTDNYGFNFIPLGLDVLEDGRMVVPVHWVDFAAGSAGGNRVLYSSHLNTAVWTTSPGGFTDIVQRAGHLTGQGRIGRSLTFHFTDQIRLGEPTGQDDPPLAFPETAATIGAIGARSIRSTPLGELFVGHDGNLYAFDGSRSQVVDGAQFWHHLRSLTPNSYRAAFAAVDRHREEYSLFYADAASIHNRSYELRFNFATRQLTRHSYPFRIHAVAEGQLSVDTTQYSLKRSTRARFYAVASFGNSVSSELLYVSSDDPTTTQADSVPNVDNLTAEMPYAETDDLDFGRPLDEKVIERVLVWCRAGSLSGAETLECLAYYEGGDSAINGTATQTQAGNEELLYTFHFEARPARLWRFRIRAAAGDSSFIARPIRMVIYAAPAGDARAA